MLDSFLHALKALEALSQFSSIVFVEHPQSYCRSRTLKGPAQNIPVNYNSGMHVALAIHLMITAWKLVHCKIGLGNWNSCVTSYLYFHTTETQLNVLRESWVSLFPMSQRKSFQVDVGPRTGERYVDLFNWSRQNALGTAFWVLLGFVSYSLCSLLSNSRLF